VSECTRGARAGRRWFVPADGRGTAAASRETGTISHPRRIS
jgi:hypothetical protein